MKPKPAVSSSLPLPRLTRRFQQRGFALIVTLSLMILLTVVAVGLLSLASISLRASGQSDAMATARANARMALLLALGDLQKNAGPDQRITARADVNPQNSTNPRLTGVWKSWDIKATSPPAAADYDKTERDKKFAGWLVSCTDGKASGLVDFAKSATASPATLWGRGSLAPTPTATVAPADLVTAAKVPVTPSRGAFAWAVMDEGVKVRINTPFVDNAVTKGMQTAQLGSGERPNTSAIPTLAALENRFFEQGTTSFTTVEKGVSRLNLGLAAENLAAGTGSLLKPLAHDVTSSSVGLFTDTAAGGLKEDFNLLTQTAALPSPYNTGAGVYATRLGLSAASAPSDPRWETFQQLARIYQDSSRLIASGGVPVLKAQAPNGWTAASTTGTTTTISRVTPAGLVMMPTIAKVQVLFSLVGRDLYPNLPAVVTGSLTAAQKAANMHGPQDTHFRPTKYDYDLHLLYTPIVTLHNPYNVALEFTNMRVEFLHLPFSMKVYRNGVAQSRDFVPMETMYGGTPNNWDGSQDKIFGMNLKTKSAAGTPGSSTVRLLPGEVKMFSPYIDPKRTYQTDLVTRTFWDIYVNTGLTTNIDAIPGWRGDGIGFDCDNLAAGLAIDGTATNGHWGPCFGLAWDDQIAVEFIPKNIARANNKFIVKMSANIGASSIPTVVNAIEMDYETPDGLKDFLGTNGATMPLRYPKATASPNYVLGIDLVDRASTPIGSLKKVKPFALLSVQAKTTSGGRDPSNEDGRLATKPWAFAHATIGASTQKVVSEHSANFSHEIDLQPLNGSSANFFPVDPLDRSNFITGNASFNGTKFGAMYDIPITPLQSLVSLNSANPGGSTAYLPRFAQPIGNSWAHPLLDPSKIITPGVAYPYLDHSFLLNLALYDHFYFSGLADQTGSFGTAKSLSTLVQDFTAGKSLVDPRLALHTPDGKSAATLATEITGPAPHTKVAAWQVINGAFNINSTSVAAWKAMLGSIRDPQAILNKLNKAANTSALATLPATNTSQNEARISRFRLPASESEADGADPKDAYWLGPREYSDAQLQTLAEKIVEQVRLRGPFLSLSEFVNRRLGPASDEKSQRGALQQAIDNANLNSAPVAAANPGFDIPDSAVTTYKYANPKAGAGPSYQGAPGYLSQADLLAVLGNAATPRSDTFTIRGYGEARDSGNRPIGSATCEAVVQRLPDYLDAADKAETAPAALTSTANKTFGRRLQILSFRWLSPGEI